MGIVLPPVRSALLRGGCYRALPVAALTPRPCRSFSVSTATRFGSADNVPPLPSARWTSELPARIGKCLSFGCNAQQTSQAAAVLRVVATEWKELLAGSEGFLTGGRRGLEGREIAWGEMDSFVSSPFTVCHMGQKGREG